MQFVPSNTLNYVYSEKIPVVTQEINASSTRIDTQKPTNASPSEDTYLFQLSKAFMKLCIKKTERFTVVVHDVTVAPVMDATSGLITNNPTGNAVLSVYNNWFDPFCISKAINHFQMSWGANKLETNNTYRNPLLTEFATSFLDFEKCKQLGQVPWATTGMGQFSSNIAKNPLSRQLMATMSTAGFGLINPLSEPNYALNAESTKMINTLNRNERVKLIGTPTFVNATNGALTAYQRASGVWAPGTTAEPYYGAVTGTFVFEVSEYLIDEHLYTPYQKNETHKSVKITPEQNISFVFKYDTDYIANGLFKFNSWQSKGGASGFADATASSCTVTREPSYSSITIESFEVLMPPASGLVLKSINWKPVAMTADVPTVSLSSTSPLSSNIRIFDQQNPILPQYILLGGEAKLYNGLQNSTLNTAGVANFNMNTIQPASVASCKIQIGQKTITENITMEMLQRHTQENIKNLCLNDSVLGNKTYINYGALGNSYSSSGFPFLLIDIQRLASEAGEFGQFLANVEYPALQSINIEFTLNVMNINSTGTSLNYYPFAYKFYPYSVAQSYDGKQIGEMQIKLNWDEARNILQNLGSPKLQRNINLDLANGGAMFSGDSWISPVYNKVKEFLKKAVDGVRYVEDVTKDIQSGPIKDVNRALNFVSDASKYLTGYGNKKGGRRQLALM